MTLLQASYPESYPGLTVNLEVLAEAVPWSVEGYSLDEIQNEYPFLPSQTVMIGIAEDERPILFDLNDPSTGALMTLSQSREINQYLLQSILASSAAYNRPAEVSHVVFSSNVTGWQRSLGKHGVRSHSKGVFNLHEREAAEQIMQWANQVEQRYNGRSTGPAMLLVFDDLRFLEKADYDVRVQFSWLLQNGPGVQIWPLAGITTGEMHSMGDWMTYFQRRIFGSVGKNIPSLQNDEISMLNSLVTGKQFAIQYHNHWVKFWLPV